MHRFLFPQLLVYTVYEILSERIEQRKPFNRDSWKTCRDFNQPHSEYTGQGGSAV
jgi:hypothetical protein